MSRIVVLSDFHGATHVLSSLEEGIKEISPDIVTFSGDIVKGYKRGDEWLAAREENRLPEMTKEIEEEETEDLQFYGTFFSFLEKLHIPSFVVPGNMDAPEARFLKASVKQNVVHRSLVHQPVIVTGFGGELTEDKEEGTFVLQVPRQQVMDAMNPFSEEEIMILMTHSPPKSSLSFEDGQEKGSLVVNDLIDLLNPEYLFCGHAHKAQGTEWINSTLAVNPGALKYRNYVVVEGDSVEFRKL